MNTTVDIIQVGTPVIIVMGKINAFITGISVRQNNYMTYEVSYFSNGQHTQCWLYRFEFEINEAVKQQPGFAKYNNKQLT